VVDLQRRLAAVDSYSGPVDGLLDDETAAALRAFQELHGLAADAICGPDTWTLLVHLGYQLGARLIFLHSPMLKGEDVSELQRQLGVLGFNAGRVDGIFGPDGSHALRDFQRNAGLAMDGICGPTTIAALDRLGGSKRSGSVVQAIVERERLAGSTPPPADLRIAVGDPGGIASLSAGLRRAFGFEGARILTIHHPRGVEQAHQANTYKADVFLGLSITAERRECCYFDVPGYRSVPGEHLAQLLAHNLSAIAGGDFGVRGTRLPVLQSTRMPAVVCRLTLGDAVGNGALIARATVGAVKEWTASSTHTLE
jgi:N-acetylmuramoyl-L-alanine amidase